MDQAVFRYHRPPEPTARMRDRREQERRDYEERTFNDLWRTVPHGADQEEPSEREKQTGERRRRLKLPEEKIPYFIAPTRSERRRGGKEGVWNCKTGWWP